MTAVERVPDPEFEVEANKALVLRYFDALDHGFDAWLAACQQTCAPEMIVHYPGLAPQDFATFKQFTRMLYDAFPDPQYAADDVIAGADKVVIRWSVRGTQLGEFLGIPATGKAMSTSGIWISRIADGKIVEQWIVWDALGQLQQLGAIPALGQAG